MRQENLRVKNNINIGRRKDFNGSLKSMANNIFYN